VKATLYVPQLSGTVKCGFWCLHGHDGLKIKNLHKILNVKKTVLN